MNRSNEPDQRPVDDVRDVLGVVGAHVAAARGAAGIWLSSWIVPICHERPSESVMCRSIFGP